MTFVLVTLGLAGVVMLVTAVLELGRSDNVDYLALSALFAIAVFAVVEEMANTQVNVGRIATGAVVIGVTFLASTHRRTVPAGSEHWITPTSVAAIVLSLTMFTVNALVVSDVPLDQVLGRFLPCLVLLCLAWLATSSGIELRHVLLTLIAAFGLACVLTLVVPEPWDECSRYKCGPFDALLSGPFLSENHLGRVACLAVLAAVALGRTKLSIVTILTASLVLYATNSRTCQVALAMALIGWFIWSRRGLGTKGLRKVYTVLLPATTLALGLFMVYSADTDDFSNRGYIWTLGREALSDGGWVFGQGIDTWSSQVLERNFMHSQVLLLLYSAGVAAVALYMVVLVLALRQVTASRTGFGFAYVVLVLVIGLLEVAWNPLTLDLSTLTIVALLFLHRAAAPPERTGDVHESEQWNRT